MLQQHLVLVRGVQELEVVAWERQSGSKHYQWLE